MKKQIYLSMTLAALILLFAGCGGQNAPEPAATADAAFTDLAESIGQNDPAGAWHFLPDSYQSDANSLLHGFAAKMDPDLWEAGTGAYQKVEEVLRTKKELLLENPMLAQVDLEDSYDSIVKVTGILGKSDLMDLNKLESADLGHILSTTGKELMRVVDETDFEGSLPMTGLDPGEIQSEFSNMEASLISEDGDAAMVRINEEGEEGQEVPFVRVEGKWIPVEMRDDWPGMMAQAQKFIGQIEEIPAEEKAQIMMGISTVDSVLDQMLAAKTAEEMNAVLSGAFGMIGGF